MAYEDLSEKMLKNSHRSIKTDEKLPEELREEMHYNFIHKEVYDQFDFGYKFEKCLKDDMAITNNMEEQNQYLRRETIPSNQS